jgi:hypothetical protein
MINLKYYREFNKDLQNYDDKYLIEYFKKNFRKQFRIFNHITFYLKYPLFDYILYGKIYNDLKNFSKFDLEKHYHLYGKNENRIESKQTFYKLYPDFNLLEYNSFNLFNEYDIIEYYFNNKINNIKINNNTFDFEIIDYSNSYNKNHKYYDEIKNHKYYRKINNINNLINYREKYNKNIFISNKNDFYDYFKDFDLEYYKNKYFGNNNTLSDIEIISHYLKEGKKNRYCINNKLKVVIYTPIFDINCGGIVALHNLAKIINDLESPKIYAKLFIINNLKYKNIFCNDFASIDDIDDNTMVIYPEGIEGNPLDSKNVIRWILLDLGIEMPSNHYLKWNKNDLVYFWESKEKYNKYFKQLACPWFNNIFYNKGLEFDKRNKTCYLIKKGKLIHKNINFFHKKDSIKLDNITSLNEICNIFNECKYFYCYDLNTMFILYASYCGCIPILYPSKDIDKNELNKNRITNCNGNIIDIGFAYGNSSDEINNAIIQNKNIKESVNNIFNFCKQNVNIFCNEIYDSMFNNIKLSNTIENYFNIS